MATTDIPSTLGECQTALLNLVREKSDTTALTDLAARYLNQANTLIHGSRWWWASREGRLETQADYTTGTVAIALASRTTVTGTDTLWNTTVEGMGVTNARAGGKLVFEGAQDVYPVASVDGDTAITLTEPFIGDTALSGATYTYYEDEYALPSDFDDEHGLEDALSFPEDVPIRVVPARDFFRAFPRNSTPGTPKVATLIHKGPSGSTTRRPRVVLAPPPTSLRTIPFRYYTTNLAVASDGTGAANLSAEGDESIIPLKWRMGLLYYAAAEWMLDRKADARAQGYMEKFANVMAAARSSVGLDKQRPRLEPRVGYFPRQPVGVSTGRRYSTGTEFEDLRI